MAVFDNKANVDHFAKSVPLEQVAANDYNLSVSSYIEAKVRYCPAQCRAEIHCR
jgi:type I restriction enzyme M protein